MTQGDEVATHCQMLIHRKRYYRHEHHHALHDRKRDQPLRHGTTDQVVSTDLAIEECQGPEPDQRKIVGLDRSADDLGQEIVDRSQRQRGVKQAEYVVAKRSEEQKSELQSLMRSSYAVFC